MRIPKEKELNREEIQMIRDAEDALEAEDFAPEEVDEHRYEYIINDERYMKYAYDTKFIELEAADVGTSVTFQDGSVWYCQIFEWYNPETDEMVSLLDIYERMLKEKVDFDKYTSIHGDEE